MGSSPFEHEERERNGGQQGEIRETERARHERYVLFAYLISMMSLCGRQAMTSPFCEMAPVFTQILS